MATYNMFDGPIASPAMVPGVATNEVTTLVPASHFLTSKKGLFCTKNTLPELSVTTSPGEPTPVTKVDTVLVAAVHLFNSEVPASRKNASPAAFTAMPLGLLMPPDTSVPTCVACT